MRFRCGASVELVDSVNNTLTVVTQSFSPFTIGGAAAHAGSWQFAGTAQGGSIQFGVTGIVLEVVTTAGQTAAQVANAVAAAVNADPLLSGAGIEAVATDETVWIDASITDTLLDDPGITHEMFVNAVPILVAPAATGDFRGARGPLLPAGHRRDPGYSSGIRYGQTMMV